MSSRKPYIDVTCPFFRRFERSGVVCEGFRRDQSVKMNFGRERDRSAWITKYCNGYSAGARCPLARLYDETHGASGELPSAPGAPARASGAGYVCIVTDPEAVLPVLSGASSVLELPDARIYRILFERCELGLGRVYAVELCAAGTPARGVLDMTIRRGVSSGARLPAGEPIFILEVASSGE